MSQEVMLVLASSDSGTLDRWRLVHENGMALVEVRSLDVLPQCLAQLRPPLVLFDVRLARTGAARAIDQLLEVRRDARIIAVTGELDDELELGLFLAGARGVCAIDARPVVLQQAVAAVMRGELWIRRAMVPKLMDSLASENEALSTGATGRFAILTPREIEIARLIGQGASNKRIALQLAIAERTVKSHLTEIFRKTGADDRLKLALLVSRRH
jgi:two-component system, NarL family, nitrate/nitrite response regulator NarL